MKTLLAFPRLLVLATALLLIRVILTAAFPVIADEAYYFYWGTHSAGGYYDLPPMVGWWETLLTTFSLHSFWLRLPNFATLVLIAFGVREWTRNVVGEAASVFIALIFFFLPIPFLAVMVAPDLPLLFFTFYSSVLFFGAKSKRDYFLSGALWGAAFLSKYFAVFSLPALLIWFFYRQRKSGKPLDLTGVLWFLLGTLPFVAQHLLWNGNHCWANFVFNLMTRQRVVDGPWLEVVGLFVLYLFVMSTPFLWRGFKKRTDGVSDAAVELEKYFLLSWAVPIALFAVTALLGRGQGLHWYIPFLPFFVMWACLRIHSPELLQRRALGVMYVSLVLSLVAIVGLMQPDRWIKTALGNRHAFEFELAFRTDEMIQAITSDLQGVGALALDGYSLASVYDLELRRRLGDAAPPLLVFGTGSRFGRVFDFTFPAAALAGKNILMIARGEWSEHDWSRFFVKTESKWVDQRGVRYWVSKGIGFRAAFYREEVTRRSLDEFYPNFLDLPTRCEIKE